MKKKKVAAYVCSKKAKAFGNLAKLHRRTMAGELEWMMDCALAHAVELPDYKLPGQAVKTPRKERSAA
jgi:hypothetical protein